MRKGGKTAPIYVQDQLGIRDTCYEYFLWKLDGVVDFIDLENDYF